MDLASAEAEIRHVFGDTPITEASIGAAPPDILVKLSGKSHRSKSLLQIFALLLQIFALLLQIFALFWVMFGINCTRINQSQPRNFSLYVIIQVTQQSW